MKTSKLFLFLVLVLVATQAHARSSKNKTIGVMAMGNIQLVNSTPQLDPGPGGGVFFDYRFNQRFSVTVDAWATTQEGTGASSGEGSIELLGLPTFTIKLYFLDDESSKWDPYAGIGVGAYATTEGNIPNGTNGVGLGSQLEVGTDYHISDIFSLGFAGVFRSAALITSLGQNNRAIAVIPYTLEGKVGFHF